MSLSVNSWRPVPVSIIPFTLALPKLVDYLDVALDKLIDAEHDQPTRCQRKSRPVSYTRNHSAVMCPTTRRKVTIPGQALLLFLRSLISCCRGSGCRF